MRMVAEWRLAEPNVGRIGRKLKPGDSRRRETQERQLAGGSRQQGAITKPRSFGAKGPFNRSPVEQVQIANACGPVPN